MTHLLSRFAAMLAFWLIAALAAAVPAAARAQPVTYVFDPSHTQVTWEVKHLGTSTLRGRFNRIRQIEEHGLYLPVP